MAVKNNGKTEKIASPRLSVLAHEAYQNLVTQWWRSLGWIAVFVIICLVTLIPQVKIDTDYLHAANTFRSQGADIWVFHDAIHGISTPGCTALESVAGFGASGATRKVEDLHASHLPGINVSTFETFGHVADVFSTQGVSLTGQQISIPSERVALSSSAAEILGRSAGSSISTTDSPMMTIDRVFYFPKEATNKDMAVSLLVPGSQSVLYDTCYVQIWPYSDASLDLAKTMVRASHADASTLEVNQLVTTHGRSFQLDATPRFLSLRMAPIIYIILVILSVAVWLRRHKLEIVLSIHTARSNRYAVWVISWLHLSALYLLAMLVCALIGAVMISSTGLHQIRWPYGIDLISPMALGYVGTSLTCFVGCAALSTSSIYRYFRERT
ncbi:MAG: hypothetical protein Q4P66_07540 [Actinomycetaceae bacterium]|nr:hypothetical protein [Actinomycetaceae bacterium]